MARDKYQYGTNPRKLEPEYSPYKQRSSNKNRKPEVLKTKPKAEIKISRKDKIKTIKRIGLVVAIFIVLLTISYRNSQINENFSQVQKLKKELSALQKENEQLKVNIENSVNMSNIEKVAKEELGMVKLTNKQTVYISLPKKDYVESASEKVVIQEEKSWIQQLIDKILNK